MKRQIQKTGVRKFFGQDFIDLQAEPLKALDAFFAEYGPCVIEGCAITEADGGTFNVAPGLVALESTDPDSGAVAIRTMPFAGAEGVALPLYLVAEWVVVERAYGDGKVKPIGYNLRAVASGVVPEGAHLVLTDAGGNRFVDAVQDGTHRFITDAERNKWNAVLQQAKEYSTTQAEAAKRSAIEHTDGQVAAVRDELALGDQAAVNTAKAYADRIVAALVDNSPELLNTLEELAGALGNDPNFATTVMTEIGKRATMGEVNAALAGKANTSHTHNSIPHGALFTYLLNGVFGSVSSGRTTSGMLAENDLSVTGKNRVVLSAPNGSWLFEDGELKRIETVGHTHDTIPSGATFNYLKNDSFGSISSGRTYTGALAVNDMTVEGKNRVVLMAPNGACVYQDDKLYPIYHSGNLKIIRGSVSAEFGTRSGGSGFDATRSGGVVTITHDMGHTQYGLTHALHYHDTAYSVFRIIEKQPNFIKVCVYGPYGSYVDNGFDFTIMQY